MESRQRYGISHLTGSSSGPGDHETAICAPSTAKREWEAAYPRPRATLAQVADHIDHVRQVAGVEHVGLGGDSTAGPT